MTIVIDTNVLLVANGQHPGVSDACVSTCATRLQQVMDSGRVAIDDGYRIIEEYLHKTRPELGKRPGDAFMKWLLRNDFNPSRCDRVTLVEHPERGFESFPDDARLAGFDPPDRKFVAVAAAHPRRPRIAQAADAKWLMWADALMERGVAVEFLCPKDIESFEDKRKAGRKRRR